jgi:hypothetical protein
MDEQHQRSSRKGGSRMKGDPEAIPMVYLLYVLLGIVVAAVGVAVVVVKVLN